MKKLSKLYLTELEKQKLTSKQMKDVVGGVLCGCGCAYESAGGSSLYDNTEVNLDGGYH